MILKLIETEDYQIALLNPETDMATEPFGVVVALTDEEASELERLREASRAYHRKLYEYYTRGGGVQV